jgi:dienelactone hydrolase
MVEGVSLPSGFMMRARLVFALLFLCSSAAAEERLLVEETFLSVDIKGQPYRLEALVAKEAGIGGHLPVAIITHGQAREAEQRENVAARNHLRTAREFARRGWLAVVVVRRGFGRSEGKQPYALRGCRNGDYAPALDDPADDIEAAMQAIGRRSDADIDRTIALGISVGGGAVLNLAARNPAGLRAVINVSGGIRSLSRDGGPPVQCKPEDLVPIFAALGERSRLPTLWLYAENDSFFPVDYVRQLHEAYVAKGGRTDFHMFEPIGTEGHHMFGHLDGMLRWIPALDRFLRANKLPTYDPAPIEAAVKELNLPAPVRAVLARYQGRPTEKAMAISQSNKIVYAQFGGADLEDMETKARAACAERAKEPCRIFLRNFEVVKP